VEKLCDKTAVHYSLERNLKCLHSTQIVNIERNVACLKSVMFIVAVQ